MCAGKSRRLHSMTHVLSASHRRPCVCWRGFRSQFCCPSSAWPGSSPCWGKPAAIPLGIAAPVFIERLGKCFSKWGVGSCSMPRHGECLEHSVCWILTPHCTFSAVPKEQTPERLPKYSLSGEAGCGTSLGWTFNFKLGF